MSIIMPPKDRTIKVPEGGWKAHTYYRVHVSYSPTDPIHEAVFQVGFLGVNSEPGEPGNYSEIWCNSYEVAAHYREAHYLEVVSELFTEDRRAELSSLI
jgi:hypothetical protein